MAYIGYGPASRRIVLNAVHKRSVWRGDGESSSNGRTLVGVWNTNAIRLRAYLARGADRRRSVSAVSLVSFDMAYLEAVTSDAVVTINRYAGYTIAGREIASLGAGAGIAVVTGRIVSTNADAVPTQFALGAFDGSAGTYAFSTADVTLGTCVGVIASRVIVAGDRRIFQNDTRVGRAIIVVAAIDTVARIDISHTLSGSDTRAVRLGAERPGSARHSRALCTHGLLTVEGARLQAVTRKSVVTWIVHTRVTSCHYYKAGQYAESLEKSMHCWLPSSPNLKSVEKMAIFLVSRHLNAHRTPASLLRFYLKGLIWQVLAGPARGLGGMRRWPDESQLANPPR